MEVAVGIAIGIATTKAAKPVGRKIKDLLKKAVKSLLDEEKNES